VQSVPTVNIKQPATRADALRALKASDNAVITRRDYRMDCAFAVALWGGDDPEALVKALQSPQFTPYLGRKSCPLAAPMAPRLVQADGVAQALTKAQLPDWLPPLQLRRIISDAQLDGAVQETFWDQPLDRTAWHFAPRRAYVSRPQHAEQGGA
jgi:CRISPR system Cascade subunit CasD